ncbi:MAG: 3'(2'),5'-bisphosphate nucleotidase [Phycisphaerae bacterium]|nr:3'(2'),5'-bisphosphate nucleotidase [Phycisphaerae bacterium]|tara:strand:- start:3733 stop:4758 length:1026 start_codon:yes stop_codon:yes gene_type:complete
MCELQTQHRLIPAALEAVSTACAVSRAVQSNLAQLCEVTKDDRSPVTVADFAVQAIVSLSLADSLDEKDRFIVGEEDAEVLRADDSVLIRKAVLEAVQSWRPQVTEAQMLDAIDACNHDGSGNGFWALDPIDGTKGFLRGQHYAIALGRIENGEVVVGVMGCPNLSIDQAFPLNTNDAQGVMYGASTGAGSWEFAGCNATASPMRIMAQQYEESRPLRFCESAEKGHSNRGDSGRIIDAIGTEGEPARLDSQCKYSLVARGQADGYLRLPTSKTYVEKIWDHAAGLCIATEAGAIVSDVSGKPLDFTHGARLEKNRGIICATNGLHQRIIAAINDLAIAQE